MTFDSGPYPTRKGFKTPLPHKLTCKNLHTNKIETRDGRLRKNEPWLPPQPSQRLAQRQGDLCEFEASLVYKVGPRPAWPLERDPGLSKTEAR